jgi:hypothetical protein
MADHLNRRRLLASTAALASPLAAVPALAGVTDRFAAGCGPLALCRCCLETADTVNNGAADPDGEMDDDELAEWCDDIHEMEIAITALAPVTLTGLAAKAAFVRKTLDVAGAELSDPECHHARLEISLYDNIREFAKRETAHG